MHACVCVCVHVCECVCSHMCVLATVSPVPRGGELES